MPEKRPLEHDGKPPVQAKKRRIRRPIVVLLPIKHIRPCAPINQPRKPVQTEKTASPKSDTTDADDLDQTLEELFGTTNDELVTKPREKKAEEEEESATTTQDKLEDDCATEAVVKKAANST